MVEAKEGLAEAGIIVLILVILILAAIPVIIQTNCADLCSDSLALIGMICPLALEGRPLKCSF